MKPLYRLFEGLLFVAIGAVSAADCEPALIARPLLGLLDMAVREQLLTPTQIQVQLEAKGRLEFDPSKQILNSVQLPIARGLKTALGKIKAADWKFIQTELQGWLNRQSVERSQIEVAKIESREVLDVRLHRHFQLSKGRKIFHSQLATGPDGRLWTAVSSGTQYAVYSTNSAPVIEGMAPRGESLRRVALAFDLNGDPILHAILMQNDGELYYATRARQGPLTRQRTLGGGGGLLKFEVTQTEAVAIAGINNHRVFNLHGPSVDPIELPITHTVQLQKVG